jgi:predicted RNA-binding protein with PIN domain
MIILIDGYNLLRLIFHHARTQVHAEKKMLLKRLGSYFALKKETINSIIIVFDGGDARHATREVKQGIVIIQSGQRASADDWIIEYAKKHPSQELLLVTMDRKLKETVARHNIHSMGGEDFWSLMMAAISSVQPKKEKTGLQSGVLKKIHHDIDETMPTTPYSIDLLMEEASMRIVPKEADALPLKEAKKGPKGSKTERQLEHVLKKL